MIDFNNSSKAIYLQIADDICDKILTGTFVPDERIPSVREYAAQVEVNVNTVMRAYDYLSSLEIIYNKRGLGFFAATDARLRVIDQRRRELLGDTAVNFFRQLDMLDITPARLADMYQQYLDNKK
jgi:DNA-binding transcriptional regulator YhcF (GntR family)